MAQIAPNLFVLVKRYIFLQTLSFLPVPSLLRALKRGKRNTSALRVSEASIVKETGNDMKSLMTLKNSGYACLESQPHYLQLGGPAFSATPPSRKGRKLLYTL